MNSLIVAVLLAALAPATARPAPPGEPAYGLHFAVTAADGTVTPMVRHLGHIVLIAFLAEWCGVCHRTVPGLLAMMRWLDARGEHVDLVAIDVDRPSDRRVRSPKDPRLGFPFPIGRVPDWVLRTSGPFGPIDAVPTFWLLGPQGTLLYHFEGGGPGVLRAIVNDLKGYLAAARRLDEGKGRRKAQRSGSR